MYSVSFRQCCCCLVLGLGLGILATSARADDDPPGPLAKATSKDATTPKDAATGADAIRKALDQKMTLDYSSQSFQEAIEHLRQKTKVNFILDTYILQMLGVGIPEIPTQVNLKGDNVKVRTALQTMLNQYHLTYVILGDTVLITTEEVGYQRQMRQRVNVDVKDQPLVGALRQLSNETGTNLIVDPRQADKAKAKITLQLDDVTLETAVRLLTEMAELNSVRVGNVLFITSETRADKLRKENQQNNTNNNNPNNPLNPYGPFGPGMPGFPGGGFPGGGVPFGGVLPPIVQPAPGVVPAPPVQPVPQPVPPAPEAK